MRWFSPSETAKRWQDYRPFKHCLDCGRLQKPFMGDFPDDNCPDCGSLNITTVIARWEVYDIHCGLMAETLTHRHEIKDSG